MTTKLTLSLDNQIITNAKKYSRIHKISLSKLVEFYFSYVSEKHKSLKELPPITSELLGIAKVKTKKTDKELLIEALNKKYLCHS